MNIVILGAGAIGSLFGALISKDNEVMLVGRKPHIDAINAKGLKITGKTSMIADVSAVDSIRKVEHPPDLLIITVKSYDTKTAINEAKSIIDKDTIVLSLQNGLDNIDKIKKIVNPGNIVAGVTSHGVIFSEPGIIEHTGRGYTILGEFKKSNTKSIKQIIDLFNKAGIKSEISNDIVREIWIKAIINSSINPLTTFFQCRNGYLLENPLLGNIVGKACKESTLIAEAYGISLSFEDMYNKTCEVIRDTSDNYSSMLQSFNKGNRTEIDSINGRIIDIGNRYNIDTFLNEIFVYLIHSIS